VVADALQDVADVLGIEETDGEFHQFGQEVGNQRDADSGIGMQGDPVLNKAHARLSNGQNQLGNQNQGDKRQVVVADSLIDHRLREKGSNQGKDAAENHPEDDLGVLRFVGKQVAEKVP